MGFVAKRTFLPRGLGSEVCAHATTDNLARCGEFTVAFATKETMVAADNDGTGNRKIGAEFAIQENKAYFCTQATL